MSSWSTCWAAPNRPLTSRIATTQASHLHQVTALAEAVDRSTAPACGNERRVSDADKPAGHTRARDQIADPTGAYLDRLAGLSVSPVTAITIGHHLVVDDVHAALARSDGNRAAARRPAATRPTAVDPPLGPAASPWPVDQPRIRPVTARASAHLVPPALGHCSAGMANAAYDRTERRTLGVGSAWLRQRRADGCRMATTASVQRDAGHPALHHGEAYRPRGPEPRRVRSVGVAMVNG